MKKIKLMLKLYLDQYWSQLNLYQIIIIGLLLWLIGVWVWIIPGYENSYENIQLKNRQIELLVSEKIKKTEEKKQTDRIIIGEPINYTSLISMLDKYNLILEDYRELDAESSKEYFIQTKGSWLHIRQYLNELSVFYKDAIYIQSVDLQRDETTNQVSLSLRIQEP